MTDEVFVEAVSLIGQILVDVNPPVEIDKEIEILHNGGVVWSGHMTTYSLGIMLKGAVSLLDQT